MSQTSYRNFAYYYNQLIDESFYEDYLNYLKSLNDFENILDLACGSGTLSFMLKNDFNNVSGLDLSNEMLMIAQQKNQESKKGINFIQQDLKELSIFKDSYDLIVCTLDSLNYIESEYLNKIFKEVYQGLKKGGYFVFDVLTQFYIDEIVNDYYQCEEFNDFEYVWQVNKIDDQVIRHQLEILTDKETFKEVHWQFIHQPNLIEQLLKDNNLVIEKVHYGYSELDDSQPARIYYTIKKEI